MKKRISILFVLLCLFACIFSVNPIIAEEGEETETTAEVLELEETDPEEEAEVPESEEADPGDLQEVPLPEEDDGTEAPETGEQEVVYEDVVFVIPEGFKVRQSDIQGKQDLKEEAYEEAPELVEGVDCVEKELFFLTDDEEYARQVAEIYHAELTSFDNNVAVITITDDLSVEKAFAASLEEEALPLVEPNHIIRIKPVEIPEDKEAELNHTTQGETIEGNYGWEEFIYDWFEDDADPYLTTPSGLGYDHGDFQWQHEAINTYAGWNTTFGQGITVAVIDEGINVNHEEFSDKYSSVGTIQLEGLKIDDDFTIEESYGSGHGNHVAGIIGAAAGNAAGGAGIAPNVNILGINIFDEDGNAPTSVVCQAIYAAIDSSVDIINMSIGDYWFSNFENNAIQEAYDDGIVVVAAAGNDGTDIKNFPAGYDHVISVAATNRNGTRAYFSNYGSWVTIAAPGMQIISSCSSTEYPDNNVYDYMSGTSQATPVVSGALALYMSKVGHINYSEAIKVLKASANKAASSQLGYGIISVEKMFKKVSTLPEFHVYKHDGTEYTSKELSQPVEPGSYIIINNPSEGNWEWTIYTTNGKKPSVKNNEVVNGELCYNSSGNVVYLDNFEKGKTITINAAIVNGMGVVGKNASIKVKTPSVQVQPIKIKKLALDVTKLNLYFYQEGTYQNGITYKYVSVTEMIDEEGVGGYYLGDVDHVWLSSNENVCKVIDNGNGAYIYTTGTGSAKVTLKILDGSGKTAVVNVTSGQLVKKIKITGSQAVLPGKSVTYKATVSPSNAKNKTVIWELDGVPTEYEGKITLSEKGKLTVAEGVPNGTTFYVAAWTPIAETSSAYNKILVKVCQKASSITVDANAGWKDYYDEYYYDRLTYSKKGVLTNVTLFATEIEDDVNDYIDRYIKLDATVVGNDIPPVWSSSNEKVAVVDEDGYVVAVGPGTANITCTANDGSKKKATVTVKVITPVSSLKMEWEEERSLGLGKTLDMNKFVSIGKQYGKPSNTKLKWEISYAEYSNGSKWTVITDQAVLKCISVSGGKLKVNTKIKKAISGWNDNYVLYVEVTATTTDGTKYSDYRDVYVLSPVKKVKFCDYSGNPVSKITMSKDEDYMPIYLTADKYVYFEIKSSNPSIGSVVIDYEGAGYASELGLYYFPLYFVNNGSKTGTVTLTAKTLDGSNKSAKVKINVK